MAVKTVALSLAAAALALNGAQAARMQDFSKADVETSLIAGLVDLVGKDGPGELETALQPFFEASTKGDDGTLTSEGARDVLHRFFVGRRGWTVKGLAAPADGGDGQGWVPAHLLDLLNRRTGGRGLGPRELAALASAVEGLARQEAEGRMLQAYGALELSTEGALGEQDATAVVRAYLADFLGVAQDGLPEHASELLRRVGKSLSELSAAGGLDVAAMKRVAVAMGEQYAHFHKRECSIGAQSPCVGSSSLYAVCCPEDGAQADEEDLMLIFAPPVVLGALALLAHCAKHFLAARSSGAAEGAEAEGDDLKKPAQVASQRRPAMAGMILSVVVVVAFALQLLDVTVLAGALFAGLVMFTGARVAPKQQTGDKVKEG